MLRGDSKKKGLLWVRLCTDLKHLKLKAEALRVAYYALLFDSGSVKSGVKSALIKTYQQISKDKKLINQVAISDHANE